MAKTDVVAKRAANNRRGGGCSYEAGTTSAPKERAAPNAAKESRPTPAEGMEYAPAAFGGGPVRDKGKRG